MLARINNQVRSKVADQTRDQISSLGYRRKLNTSKQISKRRITREITQIQLIAIIRMNSRNGLEYQYIKELLIDLLKHKTK
jgi:predicted DNA binding CopG/RHH family protein